jgi:hypothetical protein
VVLLLAEVVLVGFLDSGADVVLNLGDLGRDDIVVLGLDTDPDGRLKLDLEVVSFSLKVN